MITLRIGNVSFTNAEPYRLVSPAFPSSYQVEWVSADPSDLTRLLAAGQLDAALLPTGAFPLLGDRVRPLGPFGIGCRGRVLSLRLFSKIRIADLADPAHSIFVTPRTTTTRAMLGELFQLEFGRRPRLTEDKSAADAVLLIGDEAMDQDREEFRWPLGRDMGAWWFEQTGLSFVFAQWTLGAAVSPEAETLLREWVQANLDASETSAGRQQLIGAGVRAGWSPATARLYFDRLDFRLDAEHLRGLSRFQQLLHARNSSWR